MVQRMNIRVQCASCNRPACLRPRDMRATTGIPRHAKEGIGASNGLVSENAPHHPKGNPNRKTLTTNTRQTLDLISPSHPVT